MWILCRPAFLVLLLTIGEYGTAGLLRLFSEGAAIPRGMAHGLCYFGYYAWAVAIPSALLATLGALTLLLTKVEGKAKLTSISAAAIAWMALVIYVPLIGPYGCP
ncbi:MAG: hypothetical protein DMG40_26540 [Acidobacteria bacterium]|nr:MAG: hypothetical protein DMG40_26540 [Acidobacteriota bacterium]